VPRQWFALQVYAGREKWVASQLTQAKYKILLPLNKEVRRWSDRSKVLLTPLFPGYLFCEMDSKQRGDLLSLATGVLRVVGCGTEPEPIPECEIESLQRLIQSGRLLEPWTYMEGGSQVRIVGGALDGVMGHFVEEKKGRRIVVSIHLLQRSVAVEVDRDQVLPDTALHCHANHAPGLKRDVVTGGLYARAGLIRS
jgi:transcription antitermination factor NusG